MPFSPLPPHAAWLHREARSGFEVAFLGNDRRWIQLEGHTAAVENEQPWIVEYVIELDEAWNTTRVDVRGRSSRGRHSVTLEAVEKGRWRVDGREAAHLDGCLDVDLESSALTNAMPIHRLGLSVGQSAPVSSVYVRALDLTVERLEQRYVCIATDGKNQQFDYTAPVFDFACRLVYDEAGLVLAYPGIAIRVL